MGGGPMGGGPMGAGGPMGGGPRGTGGPMGSPMGAMAAMGGMSPMGGMGPSISPHHMGMGGLSPMGGKFIVYFLVIIRIISKSCVFRFRSNSYKTV